MADCPRDGSCTFHLTVEPSIVKRIRYAGAYPYCKGGKYEDCALYSYVERGDSVPVNLMPDGSRGDYMDDVAVDAPMGESKAPGVIHRFIIVDESMVFATIAANALRQGFPDAEVVQCHSYNEAAPKLRREHFHLVVSGHGIGDGRTVHDVRHLTFAPILCFTGRHAEPSELPDNSKVVLKAAGPSALREAAMELLAG